MKKAWNDKDIVTPWCVITFTPDGVTGESINVGLVAFLDAGNTCYLMCRFCYDTSRLTGSFQNFGEKDVEFFKQGLANMEAAFHRRAILYAPTVDDFPAFVMDVLLDPEQSFKAKQFMKSLTPYPAVHFERMYERQVLHHLKEGYEKTRTAIEN